MKANQSFRIRFTFAALAILLGSSLVSCRGGNPQNRSTTEPSGSTTKPSGSREQTSRALGEHWVQNEQLRRVMQELSVKLQRNSPAALPEDPEDAINKEDVEQSFQQAERLADGLAAAAVRIPATVDRAKMGEARHTEFTRLADTLRDNAFTLRGAAAVKSIERMQRELRAVNSTCIDCHRQFRDFAGMIDSTRAGAD
jgi:hypothetical protein